MSIERCKLGAGNSRGLSWKVGPKTFEKICEETESMSTKSEKTILIVEDEPELQKLISMGLSVLNVRILTAHNGKEGLKIIESSVVDAILSDIKMPQMDGIKLLESIRSKEIDIPFVILTGHGDKDSAVQALRMGALDFLDKPFEEDTLVEVMRKAVELGYESRMLEEEIKELCKKSEISKERIDYYRKAKRAVIQLRIQNKTSKEKASKAS